MTVMSNANLIKSEADFVKFKTDLIKLEINLVMSISKADYIYFRIKRI